MQVTKAKLVSLVLGLLYAGLVLFCAPPLVAIRFLVFLCFPLALIWFPEEIGSISGVVGHGWITGPSPSYLISFFGWFFLLAPVFVAFIIWLF